MGKIVTVKLRVKGNAQNIAYFSAPASGKLIAIAR